MDLSPEKKEITLPQIANIKTGYLSAIWDFAKMFSPRSIQRNGKVTTVIWNDGKATVVRRADDDPDSEYVAFCAALAKRVFGSNSAIMRTVVNADSETQQKRYLLNKKQKQEEQKQKEEMAYQRKLKKYVKQLRMIDEAKNLYLKEFEDLAADNI